MISTSEWTREAGLRILVGVAVFLIYLAYLAMVVFIMRPTLEALGPLL